MVNSDSEDDVYEDGDFENASEADEDIDEDILDALEGDLTAAVAAEGTEAEEVRPSSLKPLYCIVTYSRIRIHPPLITVRMMKMQTKTTCLLTKTWSKPLPKPFKRFQYPASLPPQ